MEIELDQFDTNTVKNNCNIQIIGKNNLQKNLLITNLLNEKDEKDENYMSKSLIICPMQSYNFYKNKYPTVKIEHAVSFESIDEVLHNNAEGVIIFDNCFNILPKNEIISTLFMNGRFYKKTVIIATKYPLTMLPEYRCNTDYIFITYLGLDSNTNLKKTYDYYAGRFSNFNSFEEVYNNETEKGNTIVLINKYSKNFNDIVLKINYL